MFRRLGFGGFAARRMDYLSVKAKLNRESREKFGFRVYIPIILAVVLMIVSKAVPALSIGMPLVFLISALVGCFTGYRFNLAAVAKESVSSVLPVMGILMGVGMFIQIMTLTGVRGLIVTSCLSLPGWALYVAMAVSMPLFGAVSSFGSASVLGVPFLLSFLAKDQIIVASALSLVASLGDMMPPTALAGIFAAQVVGLEKYTPVLKKCLIPCLIIIAWAIVFILGANVLKPFIIFLDITRLVHETGGLCYYDGANLNAVMGVVRPGDMGFDCVHLNLHKTFATPHGGGGPGAGAVGCKAKLARFLPKSALMDGGEHVQVRGFAGNFLVVVKALTYILSLGRECIPEAAQNAVLNANYLMAKIKGSFTPAFDRICMHEFVLDLSKFKKETGVCRFHRQHIPGMDGYGSIPRQWAVVQPGGHIRAGQGDNAFTVKPGGDTQHGHFQNAHTRGVAHQQIGQRHGFRVHSAAGGEALAHGAEAPGILNGCQGAGGENGQLHGVTSRISVCPLSRRR